MAITGCGSALTLESAGGEQKNGWLDQPSKVTSSPCYSSPSFGGTRTSFSPGAIVIGTPTSKMTFIVPPAFVHAAPEPVPHSPHGEGDTIIWLPAFAICHIRSPFVSGCASAYASYGNMQSAGTCWPARIRTHRTLVRWLVGVFTENLNSSLAVDAYRRRHFRLPQEILRDSDRHRYPTTHSLRNGP
jgi:hypothetical protein